ncbi:MAG: lasso peptide biosynthesis protein [Actinomycetota bacterium]|nr:lasso peptide biosynthesis protein [Actinomycetota bacterium]
MLMRAAREARAFVETARGAGGTYSVERWPQVRGRARRTVGVRQAEAAVTRLRVAQRLMMGFLDPVEDALFLTAGLRRMGMDASFHFGRELAPMAPPAGFYAWVQCGDDVVSTSLPVRQEYLEVHRSAEG